MLSKEIAVNVKGGSMIRKMFEEGNRLKAIYGAENVFDFSLGNPDGEPPMETLQAIQNLASQPDMHKYMPNAGYPDVREKMAAHEAARAGVPVEGKHVVMTVGAAGGLNCVLKALLNPGDEVICLAPFFVEYTYYIRNYQAVPVIVNVDYETFQPDADAILKAITPKTRAIIVNSPNNPTGAVYTREVLEKVNAALKQGEKEQKLEDPIAVISDEPYSKLIYEGEVVPVMSVFDNAIVVNSFSKSLALPGERIGYVAVSPKCKEAEEVVSGIVFANRTLGFVNAPGIMQRAVAQTLDAKVDVEEYRWRRDRLYGILTSAGFNCNLPQGAFYLFPKAPIADDKAFSAEAAKLNLLLVPGSGFYGPGFVRLAYCVGRQVIENSEEAFHKLGKIYFG